MTTSTARGQGSEVTTSLQVEALSSLSSSAAPSSALLCYPCEAVQTARRRCGPTHGRRDAPRSPFSSSAPTLVDRTNKDAGAAGRLVANSIGGSGVLEDQERPSACGHDGALPLFPFSCRSRTSLPLVCRYVSALAPTEWGMLRWSWLSGLKSRTPVQRSFFPLSPSHTLLLSWPRR